MNTGDITFIFICSAMVFLMTPALALFYGGLERRKNVINTMAMCMVTLGLASIIWLMCGYSLAFGKGGDLIGGLNKLFFENVSLTHELMGMKIPEGLFAIFQMMFSLISAAIISGSVVGRIRFKAIFIFMAIWLVVVYAPLAHMVWGAGLLAKIGSIDFAGGTVVHISSGVAGLVLAIKIKRRRDYKMADYRPHNVPFVVLGTGLLWFGWFGFNAGSALSANATAIHALLTTNTAAGAGMLSWIVMEKLIFKRVTIVGMCTGALVGLVAITPGAGYVPYWAAMLIGLSASPMVYYGIKLVKIKLKIDDSLDAFGCHGIGGIYGAITTGIFADPKVSDFTGLLFGNLNLLLSQLSAVGLTIIISGLASYLIISIIKLFMPIRASDIDEAHGMDISEHGEKAYPTFTGLDS